LLLPLPLILIPWILQFLMKNLYSLIQLSTVHFQSWLCCFPLLFLFPPAIALNSWLWYQFTKVWPSQK
jgi:hypothetical protein